MKLVFSLSLAATMFLGCRSASSDTVNHSRNPQDAQFFRPKKKFTFFAPLSTREILPPDSPETTAGERWRRDSVRSKD